MLQNILLNVIKATLTETLTELINKHREQHGETKNEQLKQAILNSFYLLKDLTDKTKTKIDDTIVEIVIDATNKAR